MCRFFTAVAIYQLQEKGLLNVTDPVGSLFPIPLGAQKAPCHQVKESSWQSHAVYLLHGSCPVLPDFCTL